MAKIYITENDTTPEVEATLTDEMDNPVDLTGATVYFRMVEARGGGNVVDSTCNIPSPSEGKVIYNWSASDTADYGRYRAEFNVEYDSGEVETFPNAGYHTVIVKRNTDV